MKTEEELMIALRESVKFQTHYARLLNGYDGGKRLEFVSPEHWIERLRKVGTLPPHPEAKGKPNPELERLLDEAHEAHIRGEG